ncbi:hypothetical protein TWF694_011152 [Orbilia ellipsospora]|uniref:Uncharacterized protein n=1 Tax=Orbilia ellipsospora TaxID=2528407 RepID=A0AAV9X8M0_9PEZI
MSSPLTRSARHSAPIVSNASLIESRGTANTNNNYERERDERATNSNSNIEPTTETRNTDETTNNTTNSRERIVDAPNTDNMMGNMQNTSQQRDYVDVEKASQPPGKRSLRQRWASLSVTRRCIYIAILLLLVTLPIILGITFGVVIPSIVRKIANDAQVQVDGIGLGNPTNSFLSLDANATVIANSPVSARVVAQKYQAFIPQTDTNGDIGSTPFMDFTLGDFQIKDTADVKLTAASSKVLDLDLLTSFSSQVIANQNLQLDIKSSPEIAIGPLKYGVNIEKTLQLKGLDRLQGITVSGAKLLDQATADGTNMIANTVIPNPSSFTIQIGNLTADIAIGAIKLGTTVIRDLILHPGDNEVQIFTQLNPLLLIGRPIVSTILATPNLNIALTFTSVVFDGQHVSWLEKPLNQLSPFTATLNPQAGSSGSIGSDILGTITNSLSQLLGAGQSTPVQVGTGTPPQSNSPQNQVGNIINGFISGISKLLPVPLPVPAPLP